MNVTDDYPQKGTAWFKDWFYPIYSKYGGNPVLNEYFNLLSKNFPTKTIDLGREYTRDMNLGEFVHFWSGAAKANLMQLALDAFGPKDEQGNDWLAQFDQARKDFPNVNYQKSLRIFNCKAKMSPVSA